MENKNLRLLMTVTIALVIILTGVTSLDAADSTPNSVTLTWTAPGDDDTSGAADVYDIRYSTSMITDLNWDSAIPVTGEPSPQMAGNTEEMMITGLEPSTTYYFAIKSADEVPNWSVLSNVISIATADEDVAPAVVANLSTGAVTTSSIALSWTAPGDDSLTGTATSYDIRYSTSTITDLNWNSATQATGEPTPAVSGTGQTFTVTGLNDNTTYYFAIKTGDEVPNWSGLSNIASGTTELEIVVPDPPTLASPSNGATDVSQPVTFNWSDVSGADSYQIQIDDNSGVTSPLKDTVTLLSSFSISGLTESQTYYWRVRSHNTAGWGSWTVIYDFTTDCTLPNIPVAAIPLNGATNTELPVALDWGDASGATQYQIQIDDASNFASPIISTNVTLSQYTANGLDDNTQYFWRVRSGNDCGWSNYFSTQSFTTGDTTPPAGILDLSAETGSGAGEVYLEWTASGDDGTTGTASAYMIRYSQELITDANWDEADLYTEIVEPLPYGQTQSVYMDGLTAGETYFFGMKAYDESINNSELSNVASCVSGINISLALDDNVTEPVSPGSGALLHSSRPILAVVNIETGFENYYYFEIATDSFFINISALSGPISEQTGEITEWRPNAALPSDQTYYWRTRINDFEYSEVSDFSVEATPHTFPNPANMAEVANVTFREIPDGADVILMSISGSTIRQWSNITDDDLTWDGTNESGNRVSSGTYLWFVAGTDLQGKIVLYQ